MTQGRGVDVAIEAIGRSETVTQAFNMVCDGGRVVVLGVAPMDAVAPIGITRLVTSRDPDRGVLRLPCPHGTCRS